MGWWTDKIREQRNGRPLPPEWMRGPETSEQPPGPVSADQVTDMSLVEYSTLRNELGPGLGNANGRTRVMGKKASNTGLFGEIDNDPYAMAKMVREAQKAGRYNSDGQAIIL